MAPSLIADLGQERKVVMKTLPATRLAYLRYRGPYYSSWDAMTVVRSKLISWAKQRDLWQDDTEVICVCLDNSAVTPSIFCQYDQGIAVDDSVVEDEVVSIQNIPETIVATMEGTYAPQEDWCWFLSYWLPRSGMSTVGHVFYEMPPN